MPDKIFIIMRVTLPAGFESISGSMKEKNGTRIVFKTFNKPSANRTTQSETRVYIMRQHERKTPLSKNEIAARNRFAEAATYFKNLTEEQRTAYYKPWKSANYCYNGKKYATLRGYVIARFYANDLIPSQQD